MSTSKPFAARAPNGQAAKRRGVKHETARRENAKLQRATVSNAKREKSEPQPALRAEVIFENERRPVLEEVVRTRCGQVNLTHIDGQIAALWIAETDKAKYYALADTDSERYADEKAAFDWEGGAASQAVTKTKTTGTPKKRATSFEDAAPPARDVVTPHWASGSAAAASVYSYAVAYLEPFLVLVDRRWVEPKIARNQRTRWAALQLMAAGHGPLRASACSHTLRVASGGTAPGQALLRRALSAVGPGELQELRTPDASRNGICDFIQSVLKQEFTGCRCQRDDDIPRDAPVSAALTSLRVIMDKNALLHVTLIQQRGHPH
jgi:hypothetical protein